MTSTKATSNLLYGPEIDSAELIEGVWHIGKKSEYDMYSDAQIEQLDEHGGATPLDDWINNHFLSRSRCPHCSSRLAIARHEMPGATLDDDGLFELWLCTRCGYWQWYALQDHGYKWSGIATSVTRAFEPTLPEACFSELAQHLERNPDLWHSLHPTTLEKLVAAIFRANYSDAEVIHVGCPGDLGVDVLFIESKGREWLVQVKRRREGKSEGFETLQKLLGTLLLKGNQFGIIATTADHFTHAVYEQVRRAADVGVTVQLLDKGKLARMVNPLIPEHPWRARLPELFPYAWLKEHEQRDLENALLEKLPSMRQLRLF